MSAVRLGVQDVRIRKSVLYLDLMMTLGGYMLRERQGRGPNSLFGSITVTMWILIMHDKNHKGRSVNFLSQK